MEGTEKANRGFGTFQAEPTELPFLSISDCEGFQIPQQNENRTVGWKRLQVWMTVFMSIFLACVGLLRFAPSPQKKTHHIHLKKYLEDPELLNHVNRFPPWGTGYDFLVRDQSIDLFRSDFLGEGQPNKVSERYPSSYSKYTINMFRHPKVLSAFENVESDVKEICFGPEDNIDIFLNQDLVNRDMLLSGGYTVFNLDCRGPNAKSLIAFILIIDAQGSIVNALNIYNRAECVNLFDSQHVLYSSTGLNGEVALWNWKDDIVTQLPLVADAHSVQYLASKKMYFGLVPARSMSPSIVHAFDEAGNVVWEFTQPFSHINWISVDDDFVYLSLRSDSSIAKVNRQTNEITLKIGGIGSDCGIVTSTGQFISREQLQNAEDFNIWSHQHKFQYLDENYFSLFDNHVLTSREFIADGHSSRLVLLKLDESSQIVTEVFSYDTGDKSRIYGNADFVPSGNVIGSSYHYMVDPMNADRQYHANIWEITPDKKLAWRVGVKGLNPTNPQDPTSIFSHSVSPQEEPPIGWVIYGAERFYETPQISQPCLADGGGIELFAFNSIRTQTKMTGVVTLQTATAKKIINSKEIVFSRSWLPVRVSFPAPHNMLNEELEIEISNSWGDVSTVPIGATYSLSGCTESIRVFV